MRYFVFLFVFWVFMLTHIGCTPRHYLKNELVGVYDGHFSGDPEERSYDRSHEALMAYLHGDSSEYSYNYAVYHQLLPHCLILKKDNTFSLSGFGQLFGKGKWDTVGKDSLFLSFDQLPKDDSSYTVYSFSAMILEGKRFLRIINKNKLVYEYIPYHAPDSCKVTTIFERK